MDKEDTIVMFISSASTIIAGAVWLTPEGGGADYRAMDSGIAFLVKLFVLVAVFGLAAAGNWMIPRALWRGVRAMISVDGTATAMETLVPIAATTVTTTDAIDEEDALAQRCDFFGDERFPPDWWDELAVVRWRIAANLGNEECAERLRRLRARLPALPARWHNT